MDAAFAVTSGSACVAVAQMTSINDLAANFASCTRLVKVAEADFSVSDAYMIEFLSSSVESKIWLSLGGFQETGSDNAHLCNTHVVLDDALIIRSTYGKIHLYVIGCSSFEMCYL